MSMTMYPRRKLGGEWVEIVKFLPGRTDQAAEQRWLDLMEQSAMSGQNDQAVSDLQACFTA